jgi:hypothetical protein
MNTPWANRRRSGVGRAGGVMARGPRKSLDRILAWYQTIKSLDCRVVSAFDQYDWLRSIADLDIQSFQLNRKNEI